MQRRRFLDRRPLNATKAAEALAVEAARHERAAREPISDGKRQVRGRGAVHYCAGGTDGARRAHSHSRHSHRSARRNSRDYIYFPSSSSSSSSSSGSSRSRSRSRGKDRSKEKRKSGSKTKTRSRSRSPRRA